MRLSLLPLLGLLELFGSMKTVPIPNIVIDLFT